MDIMRPTFQLAVALLFSLTSGCLGEVVKVRVLDASNGHPVPQQQVNFQFLDEAIPSQTHIRSSALNLTTDKNGEASLSLPAPTPKTLSVQIELTSGKWHCGCWFFGSTQAVLRQGFLESAAAKRTSSSSSSVPAPGEIVFLARPYSFLEKLLYPIERE